MLIKRTCLGLIIVLTSLAFFGCQNKSEFIIGAWKTVKPSAFDGKTEIFIFEKDKIRINGRSTVIVKFENADDQIIAHSDDVSFNIIFLDDDTIIFENPMVYKAKMVRISAEEADKINAENNKPAPKSEPRGWLKDFR